MMPFGLELPGIMPLGVVLPGIMPRDVVLSRVTPLGVILPRVTPLGHRVLEAETSEAGQDPQRPAPACPIAPDATQGIKSFVVHFALSWPAPEGTHPPSKRESPLRLDGQRGASDHDPGDVEHVTQMTRQL